MNAYRNTRDSDFYAPESTCRNCGWTGKDWSFKYTKYCKKCYNKWKKDKAEERRRLKPPNENIEVTEGVVITRNVRNRLEKQAKHDVPRSGKEIIFTSGLILGGSISWITFLLFLVGLNTHQEYTLSVGTYAIVSFALALICGWIGGNEARERMSKVNARLEELAHERKRQIDETNAFYASSEWLLVRKQVIQEQGCVCQECRCRIKVDYDLTVDHIKPRSKFPELALDKSNMQVLCRKCNSAKGATYNEEVKKEIDDAEKRVREQERIKTLEKSNQKDNNKPTDTGE